MFICTQIYIYTYIHTHTHTHTYIYIYIYVCVYIGLSGRVLNRTLGFKPRLSHTKDSKMV